MSKNPGAELDPETFDVDQWIDGVVRPETTIALYPNDAHFQAEVARIEAQIPAAEKTKPENRGLGDPSPETLQAQLSQLREEREATALHVRIRQLRKAEMTDLIRATAGEDVEALDITLAIVSAALVEPKFSPAQLRRLYERDISGEAMVDQMLGALYAMGSSIPVPS